MINNYIEHGPVGLNVTVCTIDEFIDFVRSAKLLPVGKKLEWQFKVVQMTEEEYKKLPEFEGF